MNKHDDSRRSSGRPRDQAIGPAILAAARRLVVERGYEAVTTRMIADAAGAGKQTIYRRWPSKAELILDAFLAHAEAEVDVPPHSSASVRERVAAFIRRTFDALGEAGLAMRGLMATAQHDQAFRKSFRVRFVEQRRKALTRLLEAAINEGLLPANADTEVATIAIYGAVWYRLLLDELIDDAYSDRLANLIVAGLSGGISATTDDHPRRSHRKP